MGAAGTAGCNILHCAGQPTGVPGRVLRPTPPEYDQLLPDVPGHCRLPGLNHRHALRHGCRDIWWVHLCKELVELHSGTTGFNAGQQFLP